MLIEIENDDEYEEPTIFENIDQKKQSIHATR
jgi:DNA gyrase/topoisomerase IV subunit B